MTDPAPEVDPFETIAKAARRYAHEHAKMTPADLIDRCVIPMLDHLREEYTAAFYDLEERLEDGAGGEPDVLTGAKDLILVLSALVDSAFDKAGWIKDGKPQEGMPKELVETYQAVRPRLQAWMTDYTEALEDEDEGEEDGAPDPAPVPVTAPVPTQTAFPTQAAVPTPVPSNALAPVPAGPLGDPA